MCFDNLLFKKVKKHYSNVYFCSVSFLLKIFNFTKKLQNNSCCGYVEVFCEEFGKKKIKAVFVTFFGRAFDNSVDGLTWFEEFSEL